MERHIVVALNPRTGTHRMAGMLLVHGEEVPRFTVPAGAIASVAQYLKPQPHEAVLTLSVQDTPEPAAPPPRPTLRSI